jgi:hypothetical protein
MLKSGSMANSVDGDERCGEIEAGCQFFIYRKVNQLWVVAFKLISCLFIALDFNDFPPIESRHNSNSYLHQPGA